MKGEEAAYAIVSCVYDSESVEDATARLVYMFTELSLNYRCTAKTKAGKRCKRAMSPESKGQRMCTQHYRMKVNDDIDETD